MAQTDEIDELVSSVRNLVSSDGTSLLRKMPSLDRLVLTPALRVDHIGGAPVASDTEISLPQITDEAAVVTDTPVVDTLPTDPVTDDLTTQVVSDLVADQTGAAPDDAVLRAAVQRILREELAGELGEKITRNVRKLVRREINRMLAVQNLD